MLSKDLIIFLSEIFNMNVLAKCLVTISLPMLFLCENILLFLCVTSSVLRTSIITSSEYLFTMLLTKNWDFISPTSIGDLSISV